mgnify:CR=1 FL=1
MTKGKQTGNTEQEVIAKRKKRQDEYLNPKALNEFGDAAAVAPDR